MSTQQQATSDVEQNYIVEFKEREYIPFLWLNGPLSYTVVVSHDELKALQAKGIKVEVKGKVNASLPERPLTDGVGRILPVPEDDKKDEEKEEKSLESKGDQEDAIDLQDQGVGDSSAQGELENPEAQAQQEGGGPTYVPMPH